MAWHERALKPRAIFAGATAFAAVAIFVFIVTHDRRNRRSVAVILSPAAEHARETIENALATGQFDAADAARSQAT